MRLIIKTFLRIIIIMLLIDHLIILWIIIVNNIWLNSFHIHKRFKIILTSIQIIGFNWIMELIIIILLTNSFADSNKMQAILVLVLKIFYLIL